MATAQTAIQSARVYLNDINGITWSDALLLPLLQEAFGELTQELELNNTGVMKIQTDPIIIPAGTLNMSINQPSGLINPISMMEADIGADYNSFEDMTKVSFLPIVDQTTWLNWWAWIGQVITFIGATSDRQVILRYEGTIPTPTKLTDPLGCIFAERFLGPRVAALAYSSIGRDNKFLVNLAETNLYKIIQSQVVNDQRPTRRKPYRSPKSLYGVIRSVSYPISAPGGGTGAVNQWIMTTTLPDGVRTVFSFPQTPRFISWNGINQNLGVGYIVVASPGNAIVTFTDINGNVLTPAAGDTIFSVIGSSHFSPLTPPDGVRTAFTFAAIPQYILWNGLNQFLGTGYTQQVVNSTLISLIDSLGAVVTPGAGDDIREAV